MPKLDEVEVHVQPDNPVTLYLGGEEEQTGVGGAPTQEPQDLTTAAHLWNAADYSGSGDFLDTGTVGGINFTRHAETTYGDGMFVGNDLPALSSDMAPLLGSSDFTILFVGIDNEGDGLYYRGMNGNYGVDVSEYGSYPNLDVYVEALYYSPQGGDYVDTPTVAEVSTGLFYVAVTRQGQTFTTYRTGFETTAADLPTVGDLTSDSGGLRIGDQASTKGVAVWIGAALTEEQITQAAEELGYTPPPITASANHLWNAATYNGTGPLNDTGTTGGIPLNTDNVSFASGAFTSGGGDGLQTDAGSPQVGTGDFTAIWVGSYVTGSAYLISTYFNDPLGVALVASPSSPIVELQIEVISGDWNTGEYQSLVTDTYTTPTYVALTRVGADFSLWRPGQSVAEYTSTAGVVSLTGDGLLFGGRSITTGAAVWLGQALTEAEIEQAATELGYTPPPITASANHLWNVADYAGTGDLLDTGTTGGIDIANNAQLPFVDGKILNETNSALTNTTTGPTFGTDDFTLMWVGEGLSSLTPTFFGFDWDVGEGVYCFGFEASTQIKLGAYTGPDWETSEFVHIVPAIEGPYYVGVTRVGDLYTLFVPGDAHSEVLLNGDVSLTSHAMYGGVYCSTGGWAIWLGTALTEEQIAQAATELGYSDPA